MPALTGQMVSFVSDKPWYSPAKYHNFLRGVNHAPFSSTPLGPIGTQLRLVDAKWAVAVDGFGICACKLCGGQPHRWGRSQGEEQLHQVTSTSALP